MGHVLLGSRVSVDGNKKQKYVASFSKTRNVAKLSH